MLCENVMISIPGLTRNYVFYHTSDAHIAWADPDDTPADREMAQAHAQKWNLSGIFPRDAFDELLHMAHQSELAPGRTQYISAPTFGGKVRKITLTGR